MKITVPLKKNYEFMRAFNKGKFFVGKYLVLYVIPNNMKINRLGITTSKKVGKSVARNRFRRLIRESYRTWEDFLMIGYDLVFVARKNEKLPTLFDVSKEMKYLFKRLNLFDQEKWDCSKQF